MLEEPDNLHVIEEVKFPNDFGNVVKLPQLAKSNIYKEMKFSNFSGNVAKLKHKGHVVTKIKFTKPYGNVVMLEHP